jgi:hypothetical protein
MNIDVQPGTEVFSLEDVNKMAEMCRNVNIKQLYYGRTGKSVYMHITSREPKFSSRYKIIDDVFKDGTFDIRRITSHIFYHIFSMVHKDYRQAKLEYNVWYARKERLEKEVTQVNKHHTVALRKQIVGMYEALRKSGEGPKKRQSAAKLSAKMRLRTPFIRAEKAGLCLEDIIDMWQVTIVKNAMES